MKRRFREDSKKPSVNTIIYADSIDEVFRPGATFKLLQDLYYGDPYDVFFDEMDEDEDYVVNNQSWCYDEDEDAIIFPKGTIMVYNGTPSGSWPEVDFIYARNKNKSVTVDWAGEDGLKVKILKA